MEQAELRCIKCKCEIHGAHYNTPDGRYCVKCWDNVPKIKKQKLEQQLIRALSSTPSLFDM